MLGGLFPQPGRRKFAWKCLTRVEPANGKGEFFSGELHPSDRASGGRIKDVGAIIDPSEVGSNICSFSSRRHEAAVLIPNSLISRLGGELFDGTKDGMGICGGFGLSQDGF